MMTSFYGTDVKRTGKIVWPRFEKLSELTNENLWKDTLLKCAQNKAPKRMVIQNSSRITLFINRSKEDIDLPIDDKEAFRVMIRAFKSLSMVSDSDRKAREEEFKTSWANKDVSFKSWSAVKQQRDKENLIVDFVLRKKHLFKCTDVQTKQLSRLITFGLAFKLLTADDMIMENGELISIEDLEYEDNNLWILNREFQNKKPAKPTKKTKASCLEEDMIKLIQNYNKQFSIQV